MESCDVMLMNTRLPPRKRLLAGFLRQNSHSVSLPPVPAISHDLAARIREVMNLPSSTVDDIIEVAESVAKVAAEVAETARKKATERSAAATEARASADRTLEVLNSLSPTARESFNRHLARTKSVKKRLPIKLFYKNNRRALSRETDQELALRIHHEMNSSPRISGNKEKTLDKSGTEVISNSVVLCSGNSADLYSESTDVTDEKFVDRSGVKITVCSKAEFSRGVEEESAGYARRGKKDISKDKVKVSRGKPRRGRKMLPLSHFNAVRFNAIDQQKPASSFDYGDRQADEELNSECADGIVPMDDVVMPSIDGETTKKI